MWNAHVYYILNLMSKYVSTRPKTARRLPLKAIILMTVLVLAVAVGALLYFRQDRAAVNVAEQSGPKLDLSPATPEDQAESDRLKEQSAQPTPGTDKDPATPDGPEDSAGKRAVTPVLVDASQYEDTIEVRAYVPGITENGGTCTVTMTLGAQKVTKQVGGTADATTTRCQNLNLPRSTFPQAGTWDVAVAYASATAAGTSATAKMEVR